MIVKLNVAITTDTDIVSAEYGLCDEHKAEAEEALSSPLYPLEVENMFKFLLDARDGSGVTVDVTRG